jgi:drug/metabolite transporter (DMT)-like permease
VHGPGDRPVRGILLMLAAVALFSFMDAVLKVLATRYPALQVTALRGAASLPFVLLPALLTGRWRSLVPVRWGMHLLRGLLALVMVVGFVWAVRVLSLADAYAVFFVAPLLVAALSAPLLGERVGWRRWLAVLVGFGGVLLMTRPGEGGVALIILLPLTAALLAALRDIATRQLGGLDSATTVLFWTMVVAVIGGALTLPFGTRWPTAFDWLLFASSGILVTLSHWLTIKALHFASGAIVGPFKYLSLVWAAAIGYVVWGDVPEPVKVVGAAVVVASGLYILRRETRRPKPVARAT